MPLSAIDWTTDPRDPRAFLTAWCEVVAELLEGTADCRPRPNTVAEVASAVAPTDAAPTLVAPARFTDIFFVTIIDGRFSAVLFVGPDNKSDSDASLAFAVRAAALVTAGCGVVIVDAMPGPPSWATHLHSLVGAYPLPRRPRNGEAPVVVIQPRIDGGAEQYAVWHHAVPVGAPLPTVVVPGVAYPALDLEATFLEACRRTQPSE